MKTFWLLLAVACTVLVHVEAIRPSSQPSVLKDENQASISLNLASKFELPSTLYGIFFEEIGHAGDGGLYAELVQDRSFDAMAAASGFPVDSLYHPIDLSSTKNTDPNTAQQPASRPAFNLSGYKTRHEYIQANSKNSANAINIAWVALPGTQTALTRENPVNALNTVSLEMTTSPDVDKAGIYNLGYWGMNIDGKQSYTVSMYLRNPSSDQDASVTVSLMSGDLSMLHATASLTAAGNNENSWVKYSAELVPQSDGDTDARLVITYSGVAVLGIDSVSLFPTDNVKQGQELGHLNPYPFRPDLLQALKALNASVLRVPGGCVIESDWLSNRFNWKNTLRENEARPGHYDLWGYWSSDGLGIFEYMLLAEELNAEPVWVVNNGVAHADSVPTNQVWGLLQDALDAIEFICGPAESPWGSIRASMGHPEPWELNYLAIGNEDCGKPYYLNNYLLFFGAIRARYPHMRLISNCDMGQDAPTDLYDWHVYTNPQDMFNKRHEFDGRTPENANYVYASEYAVTDQGGWGNILGAVAEAAFMTGMERNGRIVSMSAYAPLFVNTNDRIWPTNMIVFNNHQWYGIPSYYVQQMFIKYQGTHYIDTTVEEGPSSSHGEKIAASATCQTADCSVVNVKIVNFSSYKMNVTVSLSGLEKGMHVNGTAKMVVLSSDHPEDENSFEDPYKVVPTPQTISGLADFFTLELKAYSVNAFALHLQSKPTISVSSSV